LFCLGIDIFLVGCQSTVFSLDCLFFNKDAHRQKHLFYENDMKKIAYKINVELILNLNDPHQEFTPKPPLGKNSNSFNSSVFTKKVF
jgi:hypothetical protein